MDDEQESGRSNGNRNSAIITLTKVMPNVECPKRDRPVSFVQLEGEANAYLPLVDDIIEMLGDILVSYPGPTMKGMIAEMIARYITPICSKELQGQ
jgi:hypothetical protein